jgi:hypothetical protein
MAFGFEFRLKRSRRCSRCEKRLRRPEKRLSGDLSAAARGPTTSPHADFGACEPFFHLAPARPAPNAFLRDHISSTDINPRVRRCNAEDVMNHEPVCGHPRCATD